MTQLLRTIAAVTALVVVAFLGTAVRAEASPAARGQEVIEYGATNQVGTGSATGGAKPFKGIDENNSVLERLRGVTSNTPVLIVGGGLILVLSVWKIALR